MNEVSTPVLVMLLLAGVLGWAVSGWMVRRRGRRPTLYYDLCCRYCSAPVGRSEWFGPIRWNGHTYCSCDCLRRDGELRERERGWE